MDDLGTGEGVEGPVSGVHQVHHQLDQHGGLGSHDVGAQYLVVRGIHHHLCEGLLVP